jgi:HK97 family phage prohead protease
MRQIKDFKLDIKELTENGEFEGFLSVYGVKDLVGDIVEKGAFSKTISEHAGVVPLLWQHKTDAPIGTLELSDREDGLWVKGKLLLDVQQAKEAYALIKAGVIKGLSIGFEAVRKQMEEGVRRLKEVKLWEGSIVTFPALPIAQIATVKSENGEVKADFTAELQRIQVMAARHQMMNALYYALDSILYGYDGYDGLDAAGKIQAAEDTIDQFRSSYLEHMPTLMEMWGVKQVTPGEIKAGRRLSAMTRTAMEAMRTQMQEAMDKLEALLKDDEGTSDDKDAAKSQPSGAAEHSSAPDALHSLASGLLTDWESKLQQLFEH